MIDSLFTQTCEILKATDLGATFNDREFTPQGSEVDCMLVSKAGQLIRDNTNEQIAISGFLYMGSENIITEEDKISLDDGFNYGIVPGGIFYERDAMTGEIRHYKIAVKRMEEQDEETFEVGRKIE